MNPSTPGVNVAPRVPDLWSTIVGRRSVRAFETHAVPRGAIERAIEAAGWAPSPHGSQPWRFVVVENRDRRYRLAAAMADMWREQLRLDGLDAAEVERRVARSVERLQRAPVLIIVCLYLAETQSYPDAQRQAAEETMAIQSLGAATQNLLLALYQQGLDAGWLCAPLFCPDVVLTTLGLGPDLRPHVMLPIGHAAAAPNRRPRRPLSSLIVQWK